MNCDKCGGFLRKEKDYVYDVDYLICGMCGKVFYNDIVTGKQIGRAHV